MSENNAIIIYEGNQINMFSDEKSESVSLTEIYKAWNRYSKSINAWLKTKQTLEFLDAWERKHNPNYQMTQMSHLIKLARKRNGLSAKQWIEDTKGIGIFMRGGETYAYKDIAIRFAGWLNPNFELFLVEEIQRLKKIEEQKNSYELLTHEQVIRLVQLKEVFKYVAHQEQVENVHKEVFASESNSKNPFAEFNIWRNKILDITEDVINKRIEEYCVKNGIAVTKKIYNKSKREKILMLDSYEAVKIAVWDFLKIEGEVNALNLANLVKDIIRTEKGEILRVNEDNLFQQKQVGFVEEFPKFLSEHPKRTKAREILEAKKIEKLKQLDSPMNKMLKGLMAVPPLKDEPHV